MRRLKGFPRLLSYLFGGFLFIVAFAFGFFNLPSVGVADTGQTYGVTFSPKQAQSLGLDWRVTYLAILDDLGVRHLRLSAYWDSVEPQNNTYDFRDLDFQIDEARKRGAKVILALGRKLPRWPECHEPQWVSGSAPDVFDRELKEYMYTIIARYKDNSAVSEWQVENEVAFPFGICPNPRGLKELQEEVALVRANDTKPIVVTDAGEWTTWIPIGTYGDILGSSLYREAWNDYLGHIPFPISPGYYRAKAAVLKRLGREVIITELQAEPWGKKAISDMSVIESTQAMSLEKMQGNISFARDVGFSRVYLWGVEWWYYMKTQGVETYWQETQKLFQ